MNAPVPPRRHDGCPPAAELEFLAAGDTIDATSAGHVKGCEHCTAYVEGLAAAHAVDLASRSTHELFRRRAAADAERFGRRRAGLGFMLALSACAALGFFVARSALVTRNDDGLRLKGGAAFEVFARSPHSTTPTPLASGSRVQSGDVVFFHYAAHEAGYLMVLDVDGAKKVTVFHPYGLQAAAAVSRATEAEPLPEEIAIDAARGPERLVAIFRATPFTLADVRTWLEVTGPAPILRCTDCVVDWVVLEKP